MSIVCHILAWFSSSCFDRWFSSFLPKIRNPKFFFYLYNFFYLFLISYYYSTCLNTHLYNLKLRCMSSTKLSLTLLDACYMLCKLVELMADIFQFHSYNVLVLHQILQTVSPDIALSFYFHCLVKLCSMGSFTDFVVCGSFEILFQISINHIFCLF